VNKAANAHVQLAGVVNVAKAVKGIQIGGIVNKATKVRGVQLAGLLNIADSSDYCIGLINIIKNGSRNLSVSVDESGTALVSFRSGGRVLYGILGAGYNLHTDKELFASEGGIGANLLHKGAFGLQAEIVCVGLYDRSGGSYFKNALRVLPSYQLGDRFSIWAGPSFAYIHTDIPDAASLISHPTWERVKPGSIKQLAFGYLGGVQVKL